MQLITTIKLYELDCLSANAVAHLAGIPKAFFLTRKRKLAATWK
ncbi:hypothetical protein [Okeania sp. SIO3I5]|nr:hypothetical protein [Okeania sp. SIO3I5]